MAIQFDCPYCTASIRVPDNAAGKKGTCPQCQTKLVVPTPKDQPPAEAATPPTPVVPPSLNVPPQASFPMPPGQVPMPQIPMPPGQFPGFPQAGFATPPMFPGPMYQPAPAAPTSAADAEAERIAAARAARRKREQRKQRIIWGSIAAIIVVLGVAGGYAIVKRNRATPFQGELNASRVSDRKIEPARILRDEIALDEELLDTALKQLEKRPVKLSNDRMRMQIRGNAEGLQVSLTPSQSVDLIAVPVAQNKALANWVKGPGAKWTDRNRKQLGTVATQFLQAWIEADARGDKKPDFGRFHDDLGLTALAMGLGSEAVAVIERVEFRCVAEQAGALYFLVPHGVDAFELRGHETEKRSAVFSDRFKVRVTAEPDVAPKKTKSDDDMDSDDDSETKSSKDAFGRPALNAPEVGNDPAKEPKP